MQDDFLDGLPVLDASTLPSVFDSPADAARTNGRLRPGIRRCKVNVHKQAFRNARRQSAANEILLTLPSPGECQHVCLDGAFDLCHLIGRIVELSRETCQELSLATLGFNDQTVSTLCRLSDAGQVKSIRLLASDYFRSVDSSLWTRAHAELTKRGHVLYIARNHAKLQLYRFKSGRTITLMSSANLRSCKNAEAAVIFGDRDTFSFWTSVIDELIEESKKCTQKC